MTGDDLNEELDLFPPNEIWLNKAALIIHDGRLNLN